MKIYLILQLVNNPICGAQESLEGNLLITEAPFCSTGGETQQLHMGHEGWGQQLLGTENPQNAHHTGRLELLEALGEGPGSSLTPKPCWTLAKPNSAAREGTLSFMLEVYEYFYNKWHGVQTHICRHT